MDVSLWSEGLDGRKKKIEITTRSQCWHDTFSSVGIPSWQASDNFSWNWVGLNSGAKAAVQGFAKWETKAGTQAKAYWWSSSASTQEISKSGAQAADDVVEVGCKNNWKRVTGTWIIGAVQTHSRLNKNSFLQLETYCILFFFPLHGLHLFRILLNFVKKQKTLSAVKFRGKMINKTLHFRMIFFKVMLNCWL